MDKPLSQERLSEGDLANHIGWLAVGLDSKGNDRLQIIVNEIVRLRAIEAERDRYKEAVDFCISTFQGNEMFIKAEQVKLMIKGAGPNE